MKNLQTQIDSMKTSQIEQNHQIRIEELETGVSGIQNDIKKLEDVENNVSDLKDTVKSYKDVTETADPKPEMMTPLSPEEI